MEKPSATESLLRERRAKRLKAQRAAWGRYRDLLSKLHAGEAVDSDDVDEILAAAGKTDKDLASDAETFALRVAWAEKIAQADNARAEYKDLEQQIREHEEEIADVRKRLTPKIEQAQMRCSSIGSLFLQADTARSQLNETVLDPSLDEADQQLQSEIEELRDRYSDASGSESERLEQQIRDVEAQREELYQRRLEP